MAVVLVLVHLVLRARLARSLMPWAWDQDPKLAWTAVADPPDQATFLKLLTSILLGTPGNAAA
jgi:hypothetical protein